MKCGARNRQGEPCQRWALAGRNRCGLHGGKTPVGPACKHYRTGRYSVYLPERLRERYETAEDDAELLSLRSEIALTDARLVDLLARVDSGESGRLWAHLKRTYDEYTRARLADDQSKMTTALAKVERLIDSAVQDDAAWAEIGTLIEQRRRLTESEQKRLVALQQMITATEAMAIVHRVVDIVSRHVTDRQIISAIVVEMRAIAETTSGRPGYAEGPDA